MISNAKTKGAQVQEFRAEINKLKGEISHLVQQIAVLNATGHGDEKLELRETLLRKKMDAEKRQYQDSVNSLKKLKPEVDHLQHSLEKQRIEMHKEFEIWFKVFILNLFYRLSWIGRKYFLVGVRTGKFNGKTTVE